MRDARKRARGAGSWAGAAIREWTARAGADGEPVAVGAETRDRLVRELEDDAGAPGTPGWEAVD